MPFRPELFWKRVERGGANECWPWTGSTTWDRYGLFSWGEPGGKTGHGRPHRLAYQLLVGPIPEGLTLDHLCRNRVCCNPAHLEPCTRLENYKRGIHKETTKTHCPQGHEYAGWNLIVTNKGHRRCRACFYVAQRRIKAARRREAVNAVR